MWSTNEIISVIQHLAGEYEILTYTCCMDYLSAMLQALKSTDLTIRVFKNPLKIESEVTLHGSTG
jgi:superfamily II helicase